MSHQTAEQALAQITLDYFNDRRGTSNLLSTVQKYYPHFAEPPKKLPTSDQFQKAAIGCWKWYDTQKDELRRQLDANRDNLERLHGMSDEEKKIAAQDELNAVIYDEIKRKDYLAQQQRRLSVALDWLENHESGQAFAALYTRVKQEMFDADDEKLATEKAGQIYGDFISTIQVFILPDFLETEFCSHLTADQKRDIRKVTAAFHSGSFLEITRIKKGLSNIQKELDADPDHWAAHEALYSQIEHESLNNSIIENDETVRALRAKYPLVVRKLRALGI